LSLAYAISGFSLEGIEPGYIAVYLATDPGRAKEAIDAIMKRLRLVRDKRIDAAELNRAQRYLVGTHAISLQRASSRAAALAFNELYGLGHLDYLRYPEHILAVTSDDVRRVARKYLKLDSYSLVVVGPEQP
jgi:zinc protease